MWILMVDCVRCAGLWLLWSMLVTCMYQVLLLSWRAQATLHQLSCDLGRGTYHGRHVAGALMRM